VDAHLLVRGHRAVDERPALLAAVLVAQLAEDLLVLPPPQNLLLQLRVVGDRRQRGERVLRVVSLGSGNKRPGWRVSVGYDIGKEL
jgi:hypothetical protein